MSVLDEARSLIESRIADLDNEKVKLERALAELGGNAKKAGRGPGRPKASTNGAAAPKRRRSRKGGSRLDQAVQMIKDNPGISASDVASKMKIKPNYLYRVLGEAEKDGLVKKDGRNYTAA